MFRSVLVGYEGSERSEDALALADLLAGSSGAVTAACAYWWQPLSARVDRSRGGEARLRGDAERTLAPLARRPGRVVLTAPVPGPSPAQALLDLIEERDFDLVVAGSTHRGAAGRVLAGTTADILLHDGPLPVAVAPLGYRSRVPGRLRRIGAAFDGTQASRAAVTVAHALAAESGGELVVLRATASMPMLAAGDVGYGALAVSPDVYDAARAQLDAVVADLSDGVPVSAELLDGDAGTELAARSAGLDLLVAGSKGHGALGRVLVGSVSHRLMCEATAPVLVVRR
jgi:nucleotide-binding universal stress UspA family protein